MGFTHIYKNPMFFMLRHVSDEKMRISYYQDIIKIFSPTEKKDLAKQFVYPR
ncbi:MAG: hypothetical protein P4M11_13200 [Candidatus Pacebacteria bacterium]|nr:hypothetical protein [Candidatus Paceibacterota bacterium]